LSNSFGNRFETQWTGVIGALGTVGLLIGFAAIAMVIYAEESIAKERELEIVALEQGANKVHELVNALHTQQEHHRSAVTRLRSRVPVNSDVSVFLREVAKVFEQNQAQLKEFRPGAISNYENFSEIELIIKADGSYLQICDALKDLLDLPWHTRLAQLTLSPSAENQDTVNVDVSISVSTDLKL
jgi:Tfp pilus assembly protein PilO